MTPDSQFGSLSPSYPVAPSPATCHDSREPSAPTDSPPEPESRKPSAAARSIPTPASPAAPFQSRNCSPGSRRAPQYDPEPPTQAVPRAQPPPSSDPPAETGSPNSADTPVTAESLPAATAGSHQNPSATGT